MSDLERLSIDAIRVLSMDAVQKAKSGHPGTPMALAPVGYVLFHRHLRHDPRDPEWLDRDRFVLSVGHASMLVYSLLHLSGYDLSEAHPPRDIRSTGTYPVSRRRPVRSARASRTRSDSRSRSAGSPITSTGRSTRS